MGVTLDSGALSTCSDAPTTFLVGSAGFEGMSQSPNSSASSSSISAALGEIVLDAAATLGRAVGSTLGRTGEAVGGGAEAVTGGTAAAEIFAALGRL